MSRRIRVVFREVGNKKEEIWGGKTHLVWYIFLFDVSTNHAGTRKLEIRSELLD